MHGKEALNSHKKEAEAPFVREPQPLQHRVALPLNRERVANAGMTWLSRRRGQPLQAS